MSPRRLSGSLLLIMGAATAWYSLRQASGSLGPYMPWEAVGLAGAAVVASVGVVFVLPRRPRDADTPMRVIAWWWVPIALLGIASSAWATASALTAVAEAAPNAADRATLRLDALKTALTVGAGVAGAAAILLGLRRQWLSEHAQRHFVFDSTERRVTDLYTKAADQLGHKSAAVRLAGLYALERVAQTHRQQRQTILDVLCAYLRMNNETGPQEREVRRTAQRIITEHLVWPTWVSEQPASFWAASDLDLRGADLRGFSLENCRLRRADFSGATLHDCFIVRSKFAGVPWGTSGPTGVGGAYFGGATFEGPAVFEDVQFEGDVSFSKAVFKGTAYIGGLECKGEASFRRATFFDHSSFEGSEFRRGPDFVACRFANDVSFAAGPIYAVGTIFGGPDFTDCEFYGGVDFRGSSFRPHDRSEEPIEESVLTASLAEVRIMPASNKTRNWPSGWVESDSAGEGGFKSLHNVKDAPANT